MYPLNLICKLITAQRIYYNCTDLVDSVKKRIKVIDIFNNK